MNIGIIGLGLLGGSLAKAFKGANKQNSYIIASDPCKETLVKAKEDDVIDHYTTQIDSSFSSCAIIFICTPVAYIATTVKELMPYISKDCIITDVGSTKYEVVQDIRTILEEYNSPAHFVGGHPMTGLESSGYEFAKAHLFQNAYYILTPYGDTPDFIIFILKKLIERIGAIPLFLSPTYHDFATATISHVPHIIAAALVHLVKNSDGENNYLHTLAAGGFKDITRIASSNPTLWHNICKSNKSQILKVLDRYIQILTDIKINILKDDDTKILNYFKESKSYRDTFIANTPGILPKSHTLYVDVVDNPGMIANIATLLSNHNINIKNIGIVNHREFHGGVLHIVLENKKHMLESMQVLTQNKYRVFY